MSRNHTMDQYEELSRKEAIFDDIESYISHHFTREDFVMLKHGSGNNDEAFFAAIKDYCRFLIDRYAKERVQKKLDFFNEVTSNRSAHKTCNFPGCNRNLSLNRALRGWLFCTQHITYTSFLDFTSLDSVMLDYNDYATRAAYFNFPESLPTEEQRKLETSRRIPNCEYNKGELIPTCVNRPKKLCTTPAKPHTIDANLARLEELCFGSIPPIPSIAPITLGQVSTVSTPTTQARTVNAITAGGSAADDNDNGNDNDLNSDVFGSLDMSFTIDTTTENCQRDLRDLRDQRDHGVDVNKMFAEFFDNDTALFKM